MLIYAVGLVLTILHLAEKAPTPLLWVVSLSCMCGVAYLLLSIPDVELDKLLSSLDMEGRGVEEVREASGLSMMSIWLAYLAVATRKAPQTRTD